MDKWERYGLPTSMGGGSFLDVGCWEGDNCVAALRHGAGVVVGVDLCASPGLRRNLGQERFEFAQMDVFAESFLQLGAFDLVLCSGVLYHVQNPLSLLNRLRVVTAGELVIETEIVTASDDLPVLVMAAADDPSGDPSLWWRPNETGLREMLIAAGFGEPLPVWRKEKGSDLARLAVRATVEARTPLKRLLPRRPHLMEIEGGARRDDDARSRRRR